MKQLLLAIVLILVPIGAFTAFHLATAPSAASAASKQGLGDLASLKTIVADVQADVEKGDMAAAATRMTDYEGAWDQGETAIRPLNAEYWGHVDAASDGAIKALREPHPSPDKARKTLAALMASLNDPSKPVA